MPIYAYNKVLPDNSYWKRYLLYLIRNKFKQTIDDYEYFPYKILNKSDKVFNFEEEESPELFKTIDYTLNGETNSSRLEELLISSKTTAFIVIKDDKIFYENYFNGYNRDSISRFFSITKSFTSALIGIAIDEGLIKSVNEPIARYIPEYNGHEVGFLTIKNLLEMSSGIGFKEGIFPWTDDAKQYLTPNTKDLALSLKVSDKVGKFFHYNDYHLHLLTIILERVNNSSIRSIFEEKIWKSMGAEYEAQIVVDTKKNAFERMESGLCARAIDLVKFGRLFLQKGKWDNKQIISKKWVRESTNMDNLNDSENYFNYYNKHKWGLWFKSGKAYYKYLWWGYQRDLNEYDYFAMGILGQILYISPKNNTIVVRLGKEWGVKGWWPTIIKEIIDKI